MQRRCLAVTLSIAAAAVGGAYALFVLGLAMIPELVSDGLRDLAVMLTLLAALTWLVQWVVANAVVSVNQHIDQQVEVLCNLSKERPTPIYNTLDLAAIRRAFREETEGALRLTADQAVRSDLVARATAAVPYTGTGVATILPFARHDDC